MKPHRLRMAFGLAELLGALDIGKMPPVHRIDPRHFLDDRAADDHPRRQHHDGIGSGPLLRKSGVVGWSLMSLAGSDASSDVSGLDYHAAYSKVTDFKGQ